MWNLDMNLPGKKGRMQQPFLDLPNPAGGARIQKILNNGQPYEPYTLRYRLFSGYSPYEASNKYSAMLKLVIAICLSYRQHDRISFAELKNTTRILGKGKAPSDSQALGDVIIKVSGTIESFGVGKPGPAQKSRRTG
jgi:hypothetical protein